MARSNSQSLAALLSKSKQFWALVGLLLICAHLNEAQFFTKSSKSIPRMGRRSDNSIEQFNRRSLVDMLLDEYGPDLTARILGKHTTEDNNQNSGPFVGEVAYRNEQPIDWNIRSMDYGINGFGMSRDERSYQESKPSKQGNRDASLAMRALNTNRLLQYLSSGQPLPSYDRLLAMQKYRDATKGGESQRRIVGNYRR